MTIQNQEIKNKLRAALLQSNISKESDSELAAAIHSLLPHTEHAFVARSIPEQGEDIYLALISTKQIAKIEIQRHATKGDTPSLEMIDLSKHLNGPI